MRRYSDMFSPVLPLYEAARIYGKEAPLKNALPYPPTLLASNVLDPRHEAIAYQTFIAYATYNPIRHRSP